jgi:16S rRNA (guanine966-N2)-methyltransferase
MRIIAGGLKGRVLHLPKNKEFRPTTDRVRGAIFSALYSLGWDGGGRVLDLFAGSGALGIEAISRGASEAVFVEQDPHLVSLLERHLAEFQIDDQCLVIDGECPSALRQIRGPFTLIFTDPPYDDKYDSLMRELLKLGLAVSGTVFIFESRAGTEDYFSSQHPELELLKEKEYGDTAVRIYLVR